MFALVSVRVIKYIIMGILEKSGVTRAYGVIIILLSSTCVCALIYIDIVLPNFSLSWIFRRRVCSVLRESNVSSHNVLLNFFAKAFISNSQSSLYTVTIYLLGFFQHSICSLCSKIIRHRFFKMRRTVSSFEYWNRLIFDLNSRRSELIMELLWILNSLDSYNL